jgi:hypothetical protein
MHGIGLAGQTEAELSHVLLKGSSELLRLMAASGHLLAGSLYFGPERGKIEAGKAPLPVENVCLEVPHSALGARIAGTLSPPRRGGAERRGGSQVF